MKLVLLAAGFLAMACFANAQEKEKAVEMVNEGVSYHEKGDYEGALKRYDKALELDKDNLDALAEKALTLLTMGKTEEAIVNCKLAIQKHPTHEELKTVYVTYGNALDALKKTDESLQVYEDGLNLFPEFYQLHFNKGIALASVKKYEEALLCFNKSVKYNPKHPGSHNAIARIQDGNASKRIPALMAYMRFLVLEPESKRATDNHKLMLALLNGNIEKKGKKEITININSTMFADTTEDGSNKENNFATTDLILSMDAALDYDKKHKKDTEVEKFIRKVNTMCASLSESRKDNFGFYWDYYAPYFVEMKEKGQIETFGYIAFAASGDEKVISWIKSHKKELTAFYEWSARFQWPK
ncbi:MAG TPA: tetratricopeptide repeat protein [Flavobacteriales bacterium]|nr:tetratricopeptide repeat protein [Flavobacteriales bacterium]